MSVAKWEGKGVELSEDAEFNHRSVCVVVCFVVVCCDCGVSEEFKVSVRHEGVRK